MRIIRWIVCGTLLAAVGVFPLLTLSQGYLTIPLIGLLSGLGVRWSSRSGESASARAWTASMVAVSVTLLAYFVFAVVSLAPLLKKDRLMTVSLARYLVQDAREAGENVEMPAGQNLESAFLPHHFPQGVWEEAELSWQRLSSEDRAGLEREYDKLVPDQAQVKWRAIGGGFEAMLRGSGFSFMILIALASFVGGSKPREGTSPSDVSVAGDADSNPSNEDEPSTPFTRGKDVSSRKADHDGNSED